MNRLADRIRIEVVRYVVNAAFNQAVLFFADGSYLQFEHSSRTDRWAKASSEHSAAQTSCSALRGFRLNAKHLQLYFEDGSDLEFTTAAEDI